jgi:serine O-acetyltransferase
MGESNPDDFTICCNSAAFVNKFCGSFAMFDFIASDMRRITRLEKRWTYKAACLAFNLGFHAVLLYRIANWFYRHRMLAVAVVISYLGSVLTGAQVSHRATVGKGFHIMHPHGVVVGATAIIGDQCKLSSGVVVGQRYGGGDRPHIGTNFSAGTGAKILGRITIGDSVHVGANSVVLKSLPSNVTAVGIPATIVDHKTAEQNEDETTDIEAKVNGRESSAIECLLDLGLSNNPQLEALPGKAEAKNPQARCNPL